MANIFKETSKISPLASIEVSNRGTNTVLGDKCVIDDFVKIKHVGGAGSIEIGDRVYINSGCVLYSGNGIKVGNDVLIGPNCSLVPVNHNFDDKLKTIAEQGFALSKGGIVIEDDVWLGAGCILCDGASIGKGAVVGAGTLVNGKLDPYSIYVGVPARKIGTRD